MSDISREFEQAVSLRMKRWLGLLRRHCLIGSLTLTFTLTLSSETLESQNPFLPPGYGEAKPEPPPVVQNNGPVSRELEFRGVAQFDGQYQFSIYNSSETKGYWLYEGQTEDGITVRGYDANTKTITVNMNGRTERLTIKSATFAPLPVATSVTAPNNNVSKPELPAGLQPNANNNNNDNPRRVIPRRRVILPQK